MLWVLTAVVATAIFLLVPSLPRAATRKPVPPAREDFEDDD